MRPEWVRLGAPSSGAWRGSVTERQYFGERCHVQVNLLKCGRSIAVSVNGTMPGLSDEVGVWIDF